MKFSLSLLILLISFTGFADGTPVQHAQNASYSQYLDYIRNTGNVDFVSYYLRLTEKLETNSENVEPCLSDLLINSKKSPSCDQAISDLTRTPLNNLSRELVSSLLSRIVSSSISDTQFYNSFFNSLVIGHPELRGHLRLRQKGQRFPVSPISNLEYKAWFKAISQKVNLRELTLLMNGDKLPSLTNFKPPTGIYQWSLITNTYEPIVFVGSWAQFANKSLQSLTAFFSGTCGQLKGSDFDHSKYINLEIYLDHECILTSQTPLQNKNLSALEHLTDLPSEKPNLSQNHWFWPSVIATIGASFAAANLQHKKLSVSMP